MPPFLRHIFAALLHMGALGPLFAGMADSSFLFVPIGNDLLIVILVARHHQNFLLYSFTGAIGSMLGVFLVDLVARRLGEVGVQKVTGQRRFEYLKRKASTRGGWMVALASLAPPPFPFTMVIATTSALAYSRTKLLLTVFASRFVRFLIFSWLAIKYGRGILHLINTSAFRYSAIAFAVVCVVLSVFSILKWIRSGRSGGGENRAAAAA